MRFYMPVYTTFQTLVRKCALTTKRKKLSDINLLSRFKYIEIINGRRSSFLDNLTIEEIAIIISALTAIAGLIWLMED
jgi:hypothetical protein